MIYGKNKDWIKIGSKLLISTIILNNYLIWCSPVYNVFSQDISKSSSPSCPDNVDFVILSVPSKEVKEKYEWVLMVNKNRVDINSLQNAVIEVENEKSKKIFNFIIGEGAYIKEDNLVISQPGDIEFYVKALYNIKITGIKYIDGRDMDIQRRLLLINHSKEVTECDIRSDTYKIDYKKKIVKGVDPLTTCMEFIRGFSADGYTCVVKAPSGAKLRGTSIVKTGYTVEFIQKGEVKFKFSVAVTGDLIGCGRVTKKCEKVLKEYLLGNLDLSEPFLSAGDMNGNGKVESVDLLIIKKKISESYKTNGDVIK